MPNSTSNTGIIQKNRSTVEPNYDRPTRKQYKHPSQPTLKAHSCHQPNMPYNQSNARLTNQLQFQRPARENSWSDQTFTEHQPVASTLIPVHTKNVKSMNQGQFEQAAYNQPRSKQTVTQSHNTIVSTRVLTNPVNDYSTSQARQLQSIYNNSNSGISSYSGMNHSTKPTSTSSNLRATLTANQIATRQVLGKEPLPFFNGNPSEWRRFITSYEGSTIDCGFSDGENIRRLDKCLRGKAREIVKTQLTMPECVAEIIDTLRQKYGRPEIVIKSTLAEIRQEPTIKAEKLEALSDYGYKVRNAYKTIKYLGMTYHLYNPELVQELVDKLPYQTKVEWARYSANLPQISLIEFSDWLYQLSRSLNLITTPEIPTTEDELNSTRKHNKKGHVHVHHKGSSEVSNAYASEEKKCAICLKGCKTAAECSKFKEINVDDKWKIVIENKLCRRCLRQHKRSCYSTKDCGVNGCTFKHHSLLHNDKKYSKSTISYPSQPTSVNETKITTNDVASGGHLTHLVDDQDTLFRVIPVELHYGKQTVRTFAFLDEGSTFTLMERHIADQLNLRGKPETICLLWTKKVHRQELSELVNLEISGMNVTPSIRHSLRSVNVVDDLYLPTQSLDVNSLTHRYPHLKNLPFIEFQNATPTIMIGLKHARLSTPLETVEGGENDPIATRSRLGWSIHGPTNNDNLTGYVNVHRVISCPCHDRDDGTHNAIKEYFTVENFGIVASSMSLESKENEQALELLKKFTCRKGNRFETRLLWKNENSSMPESYPMAVKRLICLENKGPTAIKTINESVEDYLKKGYVTQLSQAEVAFKHPRTWYLPLFTAVNPKKPEKLRTVFDAAARVKGVSLNSTLYTGPDLSVSIIDILRRFRENKIAICGDIKEMYHQVLISREDRNAQRFLWRNGDKEREPDVYVMNVMTFGATCSPSSAQYVKNLNASEYQREYPRATEAIIRNHYVDDMMDGAETVQKGIQLVQDVKFVHSQGGFDIRNFKSNSIELLTAIGEATNRDSKVPVECENIERVLGMFWDTKLDCFTFSLRYAKVTTDIMNGNQLPTKREALSLLMSIFDPLGLLSHYLIHLKMLLQDVWRSTVRWDDHIPEYLSEKWIRWIQILPNVSELKIPRWYSVNLLPNLPKRVEMHVFVDASEEAFAAVAYLRVETEESVECSLVGSKARVSPLKYLSIPRKELMGGVLGSRLSNSIRDGLSTAIDRRIIWSDSHTVLTWLNSDHRKYSQFVAHRVGEILESTNQNEWRWVPTKLNVADEATKWIKTPTFNASDRWFAAPEFLKMPESEWPTMPKRIIPNATAEEMKLSCSHYKLILPSIADANRFSKWNRIVRTVAYATRFINILVALTRKSKPPRGPISQIELMLSEKVLFRQAQWEVYTEEMITLVRNKKLIFEHRKPIAVKSDISDCSPYLDESGLMRVKGRIDQAKALTLDAKRPIILPKNHRITKLLVDSYHIKFMHQNHESVINELKQMFYIPRIRTVLNTVRWNCNACKIRRCQPKPPQMADLPAIRFEPNVRPFTFTGVDYFGPMTVINKRSVEKRWGVLLTCLTIRAIHIEIVDSLDTEACIVAIRDFINIRGRPNHFYSDCGTNFKAADKVLKQELEKLDPEALSKKYTSCYTQWHFNPPASPHMGGCWEKLIRTVKSCLEVSMTARTPKPSILRSLLLEIMNIVNSRPLTFVPIESDSSEALTPNHFIHGTSNGQKPPGEFTNDGPYLRAGWKEIQRCTNIFWNRFITEYIPMLTRRTKWFEPVKPLAVGDLVIHIDPSYPRNTYKRARVVETITGSNDQVRRAKVQFGDGMTLWRPAVKLAILDVSNPDDPAPTPEAGLDPPAEIETGGNNVGARDLNPKGNVGAQRKANLPSKRHHLRSAVGE